MIITSFFTDLFTNVFGNFYFLLSIETTTFLLKMFFLLYLIKKIQKKYIQKSLLFLFVSIICSLLTNVSWIIKISSLVVDFHVPYLQIILNIAWGSYIIYYQSLTLFLESLIKKNKPLNKIHLGFSTISLLTGIGVMLLNFIAPYYNIKIICKYIVIYINVMMPTNLLIIIYESHKNRLPLILKRQINTIIFGIILPGLIFDFLQVYPLNKLTSALVTNNFAFIGLSALVSIGFMHYCSQKILTLRFLNLKPQVEKNNKTTVHFIENFRDILEELSKATRLEELTHITKLFFEKAFSLEQNKIKLILKNSQDYEIYKENKIITFFLDKAEKLGLIGKNKILFLYDIEFNHFYESDEKNNIALSLLHELDSEMFAPIYQKNNILGYIIIEKSNKKEVIFSKDDTNLIILFLNYISNVINFLNNRTLSSLIRNEKELKDELYNKHQEVNQYKESIRSFIKNNNQHRIGIIFYKNRKFSFGNKESEEIVPFNMNQVEGPVIIKKLKQLVKSIQNTNSIQQLFAYDTKNNNIKIIGIPILDSSNIVFFITYPDISDIVKDQLSILKDPSNWDYLLYLETTEAGRLINKLIPGTTETFLNFKIELLKIALTKKAILLQSTEEDLVTITNIIHHISLKEVLHTIELKSHEKNHEVAMKLFGVNPLLMQQQEEGLLKKLDKVGTIVIKNIHFLSLETQEALVDFFRYGFYNIYKSDQKMSADVRVICSTNCNLQSLVQQGSFSKELYNELIETSIKMPSLLSLNEKEVQNLIEVLTDQAIKEDSLKEILELNEKEKTKLFENRPASLIDFKKKIENALIQKSKKIQIYEETQIDPEFNLNDPLLFKAARLKKKALKDPEVLSELWVKFKNQNKIATFLGVNRSSVSRRLKDYKISAE